MDIASTYAWNGVSRKGSTASRFRASAAQILRRVAKPAASRAGPSKRRGGGGDGDDDDGGVEGGGKPLLLSAVFFPLGELPAFEGEEVASR